MTTVKTRKKLIEVALPLEAINVASAREKSIRHGHPSTLHLYWARRPLAAARAVIFAQMVDDPSANPDLFPTEQKQDKERKRLFRIIENLVMWENTTNEVVLQAAREEIWQSWRRACADNADHPQAKEIFNRQVLPAFHDPFAGGGALPLEAQRLGLESYATDLNPVAVMINKAMIEIPPKFSSKPPINPKAQREKDLIARTWRGAEGLAEDVRHYGLWMRDEAQKRIGNLYPQVQITAEMAESRPDLKIYVGKKLTVTAWFWARTVRSPNPAFANIEVPLASTFMLSTKEGKEAYIEPLVSGESYKFNVRVERPSDPSSAKAGTKLSRGANFRCILSNVPITAEYIRSEGKSGRLGARLMAIVAEGERGKIYLPPTDSHEEAARGIEPAWAPEVEFYQQALGFRIGNYGLTKWSEMFTKRQLSTLTNMSDLIQEVRKYVLADAIRAGMPEGSNRLCAGGCGADAYADAICVYLAFAVDRFADYWSSFGRWQSANQQLSNMFGRQAIPMVWDYPEANPFSGKGGSFDNLFDWTIQSIPNLGFWGQGFAGQSDAGSQKISSGKVISTDPPYYDNIGYADLSDFFYAWSRKSLMPIFPDLYTTLSTPKASELVATPDRHGGRTEAEGFFLDGMTNAMTRLAEQSHPCFPVTIYYAFKQTEADDDTGVASTGWETFLDAVMTAGFSTSGTWPIRTEMAQRMRGVDANALATSVVLVCRPRSKDAPTATRKEFVELLQKELPSDLRQLQAGNIAPVDLAQAAIGPGMAIYSRFKKIVEANGDSTSVRDALKLINQVLDEQLAEQDANWDADTRWATAWFEQFFFEKGEFGQADQFARAKNTSVQGVVEAGLASSSAGKVRLLKPEELPADWAPETDNRLTVWEMLHHLIRLLKQGEAQASVMLARLGEKAYAAKELAYRLYGICEKKKRSSEGQLYNDLIAVWPDLVARSKEAPAPVARPGELNLDN